MDWFQRAIDHGAGVAARIFTEQYVKSMNALGYDSVNIVSAGENPGPNNSKVYCHRDECIVDSNETGFYMIHAKDCPLSVEKDQEVFDLKTLVLVSREEAELVLSNLVKLTSRSGFARVADLLEMVGVTPRTYREFRRGWSDLSSATVEETGDGYYRITLPEVQERSDNSSGRV